MPMPSDLRYCEGLIWISGISLPDRQYLTKRDKKGGKKEKEREKLHKLRRSRHGSSVSTIVSDHSSKVSNEWPCLRRGQSGLTPAWL